MLRSCSISFRGLGGEGRLAFEGVQNDSFQQIAQGQVLQFRQPLQDLKQALLHAHAGLDAFDDDRDDVAFQPWYKCTKILNPAARAPCSYCVS